MQRCWIDSVMHVVSPQKHGTSFDDETPDDEALSQVQLLQL